MGRLFLDPQNGSMLLPYPHPPHRIPTLLPRRLVHRKGVPALLRPTHFQPWVLFWSPDLRISSLQGHLQLLHCELEGACFQPSDLKKIHKDHQPDSVALLQTGTLGSHLPTVISSLLLDNLRKHRVCGVTPFSLPLTHHIRAASQLSGLEKSPLRSSDWGPWASMWRRALPCSRRTTSVWSPWDALGFYMDPRDLRAGRPDVPRAPRPGQPRPTGDPILLLAITPEPAAWTSSHDHRQIQKQEHPGLQEGPGPPGVPGTLTSLSR